MTGIGTYETQTLPNGLKLHWLNLPDARTVTIEASVRAGSLYESDRCAGVSHLLEHLHLAVTRDHPTRSSFLAALGKLDGVLQAWTRAESIRFAFHVDPRSLEAASHLMKEILEVRDFPGEVLEQERKLLQSEFGTVGDEYYPSMVEACLFRGHALGRNLAYSSALRKLPARDIQSFDRSVFHPRGIDVAIVGRVEASHIEQIHAVFCTLNASDAEDLEAAADPQVNLPLIKKCSTTGPYRFVSLGFYCRDLTIMERVALSLIATAAYSSSFPLFVQSRYERGSTYKYGSSYEALLGNHTFYFLGYPHKRDMDRFIDLILEFIDDIRTENGVESWLGAVKRRHLFLVRRGTQYPETLSDLILKGEANRRSMEPIFVDKEIEIVEGLTPADLKSAANRVFDPSRLFCIYEGPRWGRNMRKHLLRRLEGVG